jgi:hypothetical protein
LHREPIMLCQVACHPPSRPHQVPDLVSAFVDGLRLLKRGGADDDVIASVEEEMEATITQVRVHAPSLNLKNEGGAERSKTRLLDSGVRVFCARHMLVENASLVSPFLIPVLRILDFGSQLRG